MSNLYKNFRAKHHNFHSARSGKTSSGVSRLCDTDRYHFARLLMSVSNAILHYAFKSCKKVNTLNTLNTLNHVNQTEN